jgi:hypothetical protein
MPLPDVIEGNVIVNSTNNQNFSLGLNDQKIKDQHDGFQCWPATRIPDGSIVDTNESRSSSHGLENLFPILVNGLDKDTSPYMKYYLEIRKTNGERYSDGIIMENIGGAERLLFLKDNIVGSRQLAEAATSYSHQLVGSDLYGTYALLFDDYEFLFGVKDTGIYQMSIYGEEQISSSNKRKLLLSNSLITAKNIDEYFYFGSMRGNQIDNEVYPTDKARTEVVSIYPNVVRDNSFGDRDPNREKYLIFLHGFNVNLNEAQEWNRVIFRRTYFLGFRGNYCGITWHGNEAAPIFNPNVTNALQSSTSLLSFIHQTVKGDWGASASDIDIMAHSLGNLVMWDSLRLYRRFHSSQSLVRHVLSIEAAIWEETFWPEQDVIYDHEVTPTDNITYSVDNLMQNSWAFWFNQKSISGNSLAPKDKIVGSFTNSYLPSDSALTGSIFSMKWNDKTTIGNHYNRSVGYRNLTNLNSKPALLQRGMRVPNYSLVNINNPAGATFVEHASTNILSSIKGWRIGEHSDLKNLPLYDINSWYQSALPETLKNN